VGTFSSALPWFIPGAIVSLVLGLVFASSVARGLRTTTAIAVLLIFGFGITIAATLTPIGAGSEPPASMLGTCDLSRVGFASLDKYIQITDVSLNVILFVPLGIAIALLPRAPRSALVQLLAVVSPFLIEGTQLLLTGLGRTCQSADIVDNLTGLAIGVAGGLFLRLARG
jgi:glycopeptide antibiotics resistance protein